MRPRPLKVSVSLLLATVIAGLTVRYAPLGLPRFIVKYGGSMLWAVMIYWVVTTLFGSWRIPLAALVSGLIATAVEFFKLYYSPGVDAFRSTLPGALLLGRYFSVWDIVTYWVAIGAGAFVDAWLRNRLGSVAEEAEC